MGDDGGDLLLNRPKKFPAVKKLASRFEQLPVIAGFDRFIEEIHISLF